MPTFIQPSFAAGEIGPALYGRVDVAKYAVALRKALNVFIRPHGGVANRAGLEFIAECKDHTKRARLIPFQFNTTQTYVLEFGDLYMRVIKDGGQVESSPGVPFDLTLPYAVADLPTLKFVQSADVMTFTHRSYDVRELSRTGHAAWAINAVTFQPTIGTPSGWAGVPAVAGAETYKYKITAVALETFEEGLPQAVTVVSAATPLSSTNKITLSTGAATTNALKYNIYRQKNGGLYGFIGATEALSFIDDNINPDTSVTPPPDAARNPFSAAGTKPGAVSYYEQRRVFGGSTNNPDTQWYSQIGLQKNMNVSEPTRDDDAITATLNALKVNEIRHFVPMNDLIVLTSGAEWKVGSGQESAFAASTLRQKPQSYWGAAHVPPIVVGNTVLYVQARGGSVRSLTYDASAAGFAGGYDGADLSILANHMFEGVTLEEWAYSQIKDSIIWCVMSDGSALSLTYNKEQQVVAWARHTTNGYFESVASIPEDADGDDSVYFIVRRTIGGATKRYIERLHSRYFTESEDCFFVDSGLTYDGAAATVISGLDHLEGETVVALADGNVVSNLTVTGGVVTLPHEASKVHVGLSYVSDIETLNIEAPQGTIQGKFKKITSVVVRFLRSRGLFIGPDFDHLTEMKWRNTEVMGAPTSLLTGDKAQELPPSWNTNGRICLRQSYPLPMEIQAVVPDIVIGG
jgi:hypothetical protein